jgi:hypothetical protein
MPAAGDRAHAGAATATATYLRRSGYRPVPGPAGIAAAPSITRSHTLPGPIGTHSLSNCSVCISDGLFLSRKVVADRERGGLSAVSFVDHPAFPQLSSSRPLTFTA